jgi:glutamate/tyrosine decarboxylase-like PLP-dependent enzyme
VPVTTPGLNNGRPGFVDEELLRNVAARAAAYLRLVPHRHVTPSRSALDALRELNEVLPDTSCSPQDIVDRLDRVGSPATVTTTSGRFFGFVNGGALPASLVAGWMAATWDQNAALRVMSPASAMFEDVALEWVRDLLGLPAECGGALVTGATMANVTCLAAARHALLAAGGWNAEEDGLFGAPPLTIVVGDEVHVSLLKALALLGLGRKRVHRVPVDGQGRMKSDAMPRLDARTIVCLQAGNVNTGAFDPARRICDRARGCMSMVRLGCGPPRRHDSAT